MILPIIVFAAVALLLFADMFSPPKSKPPEQELEEAMTKYLLSKGFKVDSEQDRE